MNPNLCRLALRPRDPFEVFDLAVRFVREQWSPLLGVSMWSLFPICLITFPLCWFFDGHVALLALPALFAAPLQAPYTVVTGRLLFAEDVTSREVLADLWERKSTLIGTWFLAGAGWLVSALVCGIAAPLVGAWLLYLGETALLERVPLQRCLRRSARLAQAHMGIAFAGALARGVLLVWFALLGELTGQTVVTWVLQLGQPFGTVWDGYVTPYLLIGLLASQPTFAVYRLLLYVDVRTRVEGWDLQVALRAAGLGAAA